MQDITTLRAQSFTYQNDPQHQHTNQDAHPFTTMSVDHSIYVEVHYPNVDLPRTHILTLFAVANMACHCQNSKFSLVNIECVSHCV